MEKTLLSGWDWCNILFQSSNQGSQKWKAGHLRMVMIEDSNVDAFFTFLETQNSHKQKITILMQFDLIWFQTRH